MFLFMCCIVIFRAQAFVMLDMKGNSDFFFFFSPSTALGKGPYKLVSYLDGGLVMAVKLVDGVVFPVREENTVPRHAVSFMLTSGLYKPKAHGKVTVI